MQLLKNYDNTKAHRLINPELKLFDTSVWLHAFSRSIISIFIPILLLEFGYSIGEVILYYFLYNLIDVPLNFLARWLTRKVGARLVIIISSFISIFFFLALYELGSNNWPLLIGIAILAALYDAMYWVSHLYLFINCSTNDNNISKDVSGLIIARRLAGVIAPAIGASILIFFNSKILILVSIFILLLSIWPLFKIKNFDDKPSQKQVSFKKYFQKPGMIKNYLSVSLFSVHRSAEDIIWPIFIYVLFTNIEYVAALPMIISFSAMIFTYFIGSASKEKRSTMIVIGSFLIAMTWILRLYIDHTVFYYVSVFMVGFFTILVSIPLNSNVFEQGEKVDALSTSMYNNIFSMGGKTIFYLILVLLLNVFNVGFLTATISLLILMMINFLFIDKYDTIKNRLLNIT